MSPHPRRASELLTGREAAKRLGVHENTVRNWAKSGVLTPAEALPGRGRRYDPAAVEALKQTMAVTAATQECGSAYASGAEHQAARQIAERLRASAHPLGEHVGVAGSTPHGAVFTIEQDGHLYHVVILPQTGVPA